MKMFKHVLSGIAFLILTGAVIYIPQAFCTPGGAIARPAISRLLTFNSGLYSRIKPAINLKQRVTPFMLRQTNNLSTYPRPLKLAVLPLARTPLKEVHRTFFSSSYLSIVEAIARTTSQSFFARSTAVSAGVATGLLATGLAIGWLTFDSDSSSISTKTREEIYKERLTDSKKLAGKIVPEGLKPQLQRNLTFYQATAYPLPFGIRCLMEKGKITVDPSVNCSLDPEQPLQGTWVIASAEGLPKNLVTCSSDSEGYHLYIYNDNEGSFKIGSLYPDPAKKNEVWGVMPTYGDLAHSSRCQPEPCIVSVKFKANNDKQKEQLLVEYFNLKGKLVQETSWTRA